LKNINKTYSPILALVLLLACVKPYDFDPQRFDRVLVIDAALYDSEGPYTISIAYTYPLDTLLNDRVTDAAVWVKVNGANRVDFSEESPGIYTSPNAFQGVTQTTYQLFIELSDGKTFESTPELLLASPEIDTIYGKYLERPDVDNLETVGGIQFFIDSKASNGSSKYYRYEWEEGYKIEVPYPAAYELKYTEKDTTVVVIDSLKSPCYLENQSKGIFIGSTIGTTEERVIEYPIRYISDEMQELRTRYSILVKQYAISEAAYFFYKELKENNESGGSLFDQQPGTVFGNIKSSGDTDEPVLGFFEVSGVSEKRSFFSQSDMDERFNKPAFRFSCYFYDEIRTVQDSAFYYLNIYQGSNITDYSIMTGELTIQSQACTDCSYYAELTPPDYWVN
jgi:hypothetical protein